MLIRIDTVVYDRIFNKYTTAPLETKHLRMSAGRNVESMNNNTRPETRNSGSHESYKQLDSHLCDSVKGRNAEADRYH